MAARDHGAGLSPEQMAEVSRRLAEFRHDVNNQLTLITTGLELMRRNPDSVERIAGKLLNQPARLRDLVRQVSAELERLLGIKPT